MNNLPFNEKFAQIWEEWLQYRKERRLPGYKPTGIKRTLAAIVRDSDGIEEIAVKMIEQSIEQNWQGIFKLKINGHSTTSASDKQRGAKQLVAIIKQDFAAGRKEGD